MGSLHATPVQETLSLDLFTLHIGEGLGKKSFTVKRSVLFTQSSYFSAHFDMDEDTARIIVEAALPQEASNTFALIIDWLHRRVLPASPSLDTPSARLVWTIPLNKELRALLLKSLPLIMRPEIGKGFAKPFAASFPEAAARYAEEIPEPIDLEEIFRRVKNRQYTPISTFKSDVDLMYINALTFEEYESTWVKKAHSVREKIFKLILPYELAPPSEEIHAESFPEARITEWWATRGRSGKYGRL